MLRSWNVNVGGFNHHLLRWTDENSKLKPGMNHRAPVYCCFTSIKALGDGQTRQTVRSQGLDAWLIRSVMQQAFFVRSYCSRITSCHVRSGVSRLRFLKWKQQRAVKTSWLFSSPRRLSLLCCCEIYTLCIRLKAKPHTAVVVKCKKNPKH